MPKTPQFDLSTMCGGFMAKLFENLPKVFRRDPRSVAGLQLTLDSPAPFRYLSIENSTLYFHQQPLKTAAYTPEVSVALEDVDLAGLAARIRSDVAGVHAVEIAGSGSSAAVLLLGFIDFDLSAGDQVALEVATSRSWKFLYPIAQILHGAEQRYQYAENVLSMPFTRGFWLDFWGDWLNIPRLPGMNDFGYVAYLIRTLRLPKVNNLAIEDILTSKFGLPTEVRDSAPKEFTISMDAEGISITEAEIASIVNEVKAVGVRWLLTYYSENAEDFRAYFYDRQNQTEFKNSDRLGVVLRLPPEETYGYTQGGLITNEDTLNNTTLNGGRTVTEDKVEMFYNDRNDPSYTVL